MKTKVTMKLVFCFSCLLVGVDAVRRTTPSRMLRGKGKSSKKQKKKKNCKGSHIGKHGVPKVLEDQDEVSLFASALEATNFWNLLDCHGSVNDEMTVTVLAPTNRAWDPLPVERYLLDPEQWALHLQSVLSMHVIVHNGDLDTNGDYSSTTLITWNPSETVVTSNPGPCFSPGLGCVVSSDLLDTASSKSATGRVAMYEIDHVLTPAWMAMTLTDVLISHSYLLRLEAFLLCAGMVQDLTETTGWTMLAPNDQALFTSLDHRFYCSPAGRNQLREILQYHIIPSVVPSTILLGEEHDCQPVQSTWPTLLPGAYVTLTHTCPEKVIVNQDSTVVEANILASNGILHVIDRLLVPPSDTENEMLAITQKEGKSGASKKKSSSSRGKGKSTDRRLNI